MAAIDSTQISASQYLTQSDLTNFYKDVLNNQSDNFSYLILTLIGITTLLVGFSLLWNFVIARSRIKSQVEKRVSKLKDSLIAEIYQKVDKEVTLKIDSLVITMKIDRAHLYKLYSINSYNAGDYSNAVCWIIRAIKNYSESEMHDLLRNSVDLLIEILENPNFHSKLRNSWMKYEDCIEIINNHIPLTLHKEKDRILKLFEAKKPVEVPELPLTV